MCYLESLESAIAEAGWGGWWWLIPGGWWIRGSRRGVYCVTVTVGGGEWEGERRTGGRGRHSTAITLTADTVVNAAGFGFGAVAIKYITSLLGESNHTRRGFLSRISPRGGTVGWGGGGTHLTLDLTGRVR